MTQHATNFTVHSALTKQNGRRSIKLLEKTDLQYLRHACVSLKAVLDEAEVEKVRLDSQVDEEEHH